MATAARVVAHMKKVVGVGMGVIGVDVCGRE
jgi:hypothetical protein